jgi:hypothetical protein
MAAFGQGINPALGRIDYSPYAQGAAMGAQGIAQGIAALGQGAAIGVQNYLKRKEEKQQEEAAISSIGGILKRNPELASQLNLQADAAGNFDQGALKAAIKGAGGPANTLKLAATLEELGVQRQARQQQEQAASYAAMLRQGGGQVPSPVSNQALAQFSPQARIAGESAYLQGEQARANLAKTRAEEAALLAPKPVGVESLRFASQQEKDASDKRIADRANQIALKQPGSALSNKAEENAARVAAAKIYESGLVNTTTEVVNPTTGQPEFFQETRNITGELVGRKPVYAPNASPEEQALAAEKVAAAQSSVKWMDTFSENASLASTRLAKNKAAIALLESGNVKTGPGTPFIQGVRRVFAAYGGDPKAISDTANFGLVTNLLGDQVFDYFQKTKGAISDYETKYISNLSAKENKTNAENVAILKMAVAIDERTQNAKKALREAQKSGQVKNARDERRFIEDYVDNNPLDFAKLSAMTLDEIVERNLRPGRK